MVKKLLTNSGAIRNTDSIPGSGKFPGGEHDNPLQYSCLENPMERGGLAGSSPWSCKELGMTEVTEHNIFHCMTILCCIYPSISVKIFGLFALLTMTNNVAMN